MEGEITFEKLEAAGFSGAFNRHFTYRCFPAPLYGNYRIDFRTPQNEPNTYPTNCWYIYLESGTQSCTLRHISTMEQVNNFYHGMTDKWLF